MHTLTVDQKEQLVEILIEKFGKQLDLDEFSEALRDLLDDIAGFETATKAETEKFIVQIWRKYNG